MNRRADHWEYKTWKQAVASAARFASRHARRYEVRFRDGSWVVSAAPLTAGQKGARMALRTVLLVLDSWIEGARSNHGALGHRDDIYGCCLRWDSADFRTMVNDAARELLLGHDIPKPVQRKGSEVTR